MELHYFSAFAKNASRIGRSSPGMTPSGPLTAFFTFISRHRYPAKYRTKPEGIRQATSNPPENWGLFYVTRNESRKHRKCRECSPGTGPKPTILSAISTVNIIRNMRFTTSNASERSSARSCPRPGHSQKDMAEHPGIFEVRREMR